MHLQSAARWPGRTHLDRPSAQRGHAAQCRQAAQLFLGRHDFTQFANAGAPGVDPHKTLTRFDVVAAGPDQLRFEVEGSGFLHRMVRHMVRAMHFSRTVL